MIPKILRRPTLVLNRSWQPVNVATVARAIALVWNQHARIVEPDDFQLSDWDDWSKLPLRDNDEFIQAVSQRFRVPEVIVLVRYDRVPNGKVAFNRRNLFKRDHYTCQYCGKKPSPDELTIDHIVPRSQGGVSSWTNCVLACIDCNHRKADRSLAQARLKLSSPPVQPRWSPMFCRDATRISSWQKFISEAYWSVDLQD